MIWPMSNAVFEQIPPVDQVPLSNFVRPTVPGEGES